MELRRDDRRRLVSNLRMGLCAVGLWLGLSAGASGLQPNDRLELPYPDLASLEAGPRQKVESMQAALERLRQEPETPVGDLVESFGYLGQLFHAFRFLDAAEVCYLNAESLGIDDYRWAYYLGLVRNARGELEDAVRDYERALRLRRDDLATLLRLGNALLDLNLHERALDRFSRVLELDRDSGAAHYGIGRAAALSGDTETAVDSFERALALQPDARAVHYPLAQTYRKLGDLDKARSHLTQRGEEKPRFTDPLGDRISRLEKRAALEVAIALARNHEGSTRDFLGFALSQFSDVEGAIEQLQDGLRLEDEIQEMSASERARLHYLLGGLLVNDARDDEAVPQFSIAVQLDPGLLDARIKWGNALARAGSLSEAIEHYTAVLEIEPRHSAALLKRAAALMALARSGEAALDLELLIAEEPSSEAHVRLASLLAEGEPGAAISNLRAAIDLEQSLEERVRSLLQLGSLQAGQGSFEDALASFRLAVESDPRSVPALDAEASLLGRLGRFEESAALFSSLVALRPSSTFARVGEATALIYAQKHAEARDRLEEGLVAMPGNINLRDVLARHLAASPDLSVRDGERAVELARGIYQEFQTPESIETLAMALAQDGSFEEAVEWQQRLLERVRELATAEDRRRLELNLERYRRSEACCADL